MNPEEEPQNPEPNTLKQIRTYQGDVARALKEGKHSLVSIQRAEQARGEVAASPNRTRISKVIWLTLGTITLLALGSLGGYYSYKEYMRKTAPRDIVAPANRFISSASEINIDASDLGREALINVLSREGEEVSSGEIHHLILREGVGPSASLLTVTKFLTALETRAPSSLIRALDPLFMYGVLGGGTKSNFLILEVRSFENAYAGMLDWESTLADDLGPLFETREVLKTIGLQSVFVDTTDRNKDVRVLRDPQGEEALLYSFLDRDFLIVTDSLDTLRTLIERLTRGKLTR